MQTQNIMRGTSERDTGDAPGSPSSAGCVWPGPRPFYSLRPYQVKAVEVVKTVLKTRDNCLLSAPCAAGKTIIFSEIVKWLQEHDRRCLILLDRENLVTQTALRLGEHVGCNIGIACATASASRRLDSPVVVASRQTLAPMLRNGHAQTQFNIVILDEAHLVSNAKNGQYRAILTHLKANYPAMRVMGCTATPYRMSGGKIYGKGKLFSELDYRISTEELLEAGYLVPLSWKVRQSDLNAQLDLVKRSSTGELDEQEQYAVLGQDAFIEGVYDIWLQYAIDRKTAIFALNIAHSESIGSVFEAHGIKVWVIHSKLKAGEVKSRISEFIAGTGVIINVGILTIGSDIPAISCIILARRTMSTALFFQIVGRGARLFPAKENCLVLDLCSNALIHGIDPDNPIRQEQDPSGDGRAKTKICPMCEEAVHMASKKCKSCGFEFPIKEPEPKELRESKDVLLTDFTGFQRAWCDAVKYTMHRNPSKPIPTVKAEYRMKGDPVARQWLCPQHEIKTFPQQKAARYWTALGGRYPIPKTVNEWIIRASELSSDLELTINFTGEYPEVKKVKRC